MVRVLLFIFFLAHPFSIKSSSAGQNGDMEKKDAAVNWEELAWEGKVSHFYSCLKKEQEKIEWEKLSFCYFNFNEEEKNKIKKLFLSSMLIEVSSCCHSSKAYECDMNYLRIIRDNIFKALLERKYSTAKDSLTNFWNLKRVMCFLNHVHLEAPPSPIKPSGPNMLS